MPEKGALGAVVEVVVGETEVGLWLVAVVVVVKVLGDEGAEEGMFLGRYWTPVAGQVDLVPSVFCWYLL